MTAQPPREARLKPEAAHLYPEISPGIWLPAADLGAQLLLWQLQAPRPTALGDRLLDEQHFDFRGGLRRGVTSPLRTRAGEELGPTERAS